MTKEDLLTQISDDTLVIVSVDQQADPVKEAAGINSYIAHVMEQRSDSVHGRNIGFYVKDEGGAGEEAWLRDTPQKKSVARELMVTYLESLRPATFLWYEITSVDETQRVGRATVIDASDMTEKRIVVYKIGTDPVAHAVLTTL